MGAISEVSLIPLEVQNPPSTAAINDVSVDQPNGKVWVKTTNGWIQVHPSAIIASSNGPAVSNGDPIFWPQGGGLFYGLSATWARNSDGTLGSSIVLNWVFPVSALLSGKRLTLQRSTSATNTILTAAEIAAGLGKQVVYDNNTPPFSPPPDSNWTTIFTQGALGGTGLANYATTFTDTTVPPTGSMQAYRLIMVVGFVNFELEIDYNIVGFTGPQPFTVSGNGAPYTISWPVPTITWT